MGVNSLPKAVTRQCHDCDLNPGPSAPKYTMLTTRPPIVNNNNVSCNDRIHYSNPPGHVLQRLSSCAAAYLGQGRWELKPIPRLD